ncbi:putative acetyltransferase, partial [Angustibacter aerolatus]
MSRQPGPRVGADDVGRRVVLRRRLPGGRVGDLLGELLAWDPAGLARVRTRAGEVSVPVREVLAGEPE